MEIKYRCLLRKKNCFNFLLFLLQQIIIMYVCATIEIWCWQLAQCAIDVSFVYFSLQLLLFWLDRMMIACKYLITKNYLSRMCLVIYDTWTKFNRTICSTFFFVFFYWYCWTNYWHSQRCEKGKKRSLILRWMEKSNQTHKSWDCFSLAS